jgi:nicotinate-nucleotide adenylyltransferase
VALNPAVGILGGTFDPIHFGHLRLALELREALQLAEVRLIPNRAPPHRAAPLASGEQRAAWIARALEGASGLVLDRRELARDGPSYTVDTLRALRAELPHAPLCLILGVDAFAGFLSWREPREILALAHLVLVPRPDTRVLLGLELSNLLAERAQPAAGLRSALAGAIHECAVTPLAISSQQIRALAAAGRSARYLLPDAVWTEIERAGIYRASRQEG